MCFICLFFFKQKTAYEMRISDWSSDVCSSDLLLYVLVAIERVVIEVHLRVERHHLSRAGHDQRVDLDDRGIQLDERLVHPGQEPTRRASWRERVCQYV